MAEQGVYAYLPCEESALPLVNDEVGCTPTRLLLRGSAAAEG